MDRRTESRAFPAPAQGAAIGRFLRLIRFSHTIFVLPFALGALVVAGNGAPSPRVIVLVLACMITARTAAMLFNRLADWQIDQRNPRTRLRHLLVGRNSVIVSLVVSCVLFIFAAASINRLTFLLSPVALAVVFFYSVTKRITDATHFFLGLALAIAPVAAWIAQTGRVQLPPLILALAVLVWVAGFDLIYATQDHDFDHREGLHSLVVRLGIAGSLRLAKLLHILTFVALILFGTSAKLGVTYFGAMLLVAASLFYEHRSAQKLDIAGINRAFFNSNAFVSALFLAAVCIDRWW